MIATAKIVIGFRVKSKQTGVALLQVLLISSVISLLAIRFSQTAQDQIATAVQIEDRTRAQLLVHSAMNEVIFSLISDDYEAVSESSSQREKLITKYSDLNLYGLEIAWDVGVTVTVQDLSGLLPQIFPNHPFWRRVLERANVADERIDKYIGEWRDFQDADSDSWSMGDEPLKLTNGQYYANGYAQNDDVLKIIYEDSPELTNLLLKISDVNAPFETNLLNSPLSVLRALFDPITANEIIDLRQKRRLDETSLDALLPQDINRNVLTYANSRIKAIQVSASVGSSFWREKRLIELDISLKPPFKTLLIN